jgi:hypothetical protein
VTFEILTTTLASRGVALFLEGDALRFRGPKGALTEELKQQIAAQRGEIIDRLRETAARVAESRAAPCRCDVNGWVDEPTHEGRIRTHCGQCGRFIGCRPEKLAPVATEHLSPGATRRKWHCWRGCAPRRIRRRT